MACKDLLSLYPDNQSYNPNGDYAERGNWLLSAEVELRNTDSLDFVHKESGFMDFANRLSTRVVHGIVNTTPLTGDDDSNGCHLECALLSSSMTPEELDTCFTCITRIIDANSDVENTPPVIAEYLSVYNTIESSPNKKELMSTAFNCLGCLSDGYYNAPDQSAETLDHQNSAAYKYIVDHACNCLEHNEGAKKQRTTNPALPFIMVVSIITIVCIVGVVYLMKQKRS